MAVAESGNLCPNCFQICYKNGKCQRCGYSAKELPQYELVLPPGTVLDNQYLVGRVLGIGGFGITYLAMHTQSRKLCAIKEYFPTSLATRNYDSSVSTGRNKETFHHGLKAFISEAELLITFLGNPYIVQVISAFQEKGTAYYAMEYLSGVNAGALAKSIGGQLPYNIALEILQRVSYALQHIHKRSLLHRDVSPENIFITRDGNVKLIDFGATRYFVGEKSRSLSVVLKPGFAPLEQYSRKGNQGPWTDIYALAASFYYISSGRMLPSPQDRLAGKPVPLLKDIVPDISPAISEIIDVALRLDYRDRFQTIDNFLSVVQTEMQGSAQRKTAVQKTSISPYSQGANRNHYLQEKSRSPYLLVLSGSFKGNKWTISSSGEIVIGRSAQHSNIVMDDPRISRRHCVIRFDSRKGCFYIKDTSSNGTFRQNGERYDAGSYSVLMPESKFYLTSADFMILAGLE